MNDAQLDSLRAALTDPNSPTLEGFIRAVGFLSATFRGDFDRAAAVIEGLDGSARRDLLLASISSLRTTLDVDDADAALDVLRVASRKSPHAHLLYAVLSDFPDAYDVYTERVIPAMTDEAVTAQLWAFAATTGLLLAQCGIDPEIVATSEEHTCGR